MPRSRKKKKQKKSTKLKPRSVKLLGGSSIEKPKTKKKNKLGWPFVQTLKERY